MTPFQWIGEHESILSGIVALTVLASLVWTAVSRLRPKPQTSPATTSRLEKQEVRFCKTVDGHRVAYSVVGAGKPLIRCLGWFTHLELEWQSKLGGGFWQRLARNHELIRYDGRGIGLSAPTMDFHPESRMQDLEAVIEACGHERFALAGTSEGCGTALRYAVAHPERVEKLILYGPAVPPALDDDVMETYRAYAGLIRAGWGKASHRKFFADVFIGPSAGPDAVSYFEEMQRASASPEVAAAYFENMTSAGTSAEVAPEIRVPTLVIHAREDLIIPFEWGQCLAGEIPGARLKVTESDCHWLLMSADSELAEEYAEAIESFLAED